MSVSQLSRTMNDEGNEELTVFSYLLYAVPVESIIRKVGAVR